MKILYLHGLDSFLQDDRRVVLQTFGTVLAPILDYKNTPNLFQKLQNEFTDVQAIIGSSVGGLATYYLAQALNKPCLLFNPALNFRDQLPINTAFNPSYSGYMRLVIGLRDEVIPAWEVVDIVKNDILENQNIDIQLISRMKHSYPISIFQEEVSIFFTKLASLS